MPSIANDGGGIATNDLKSPITDKSFWRDRYVLCELTFRKKDGEQLVMNDAVCAISRSRNIVETQIVGMEGTIKEYIDEGDYQVNITVGIAAVRDGVIVDEYPSDGICRLRKFFDEKDAIQVHSEFLKIFDIDRLVIKSFSVSQTTALNYQSVSISAESDNEANYDKLIYTEY